MSIGQGWHLEGEAAAGWRRRPTLRRANLPVLEREGCAEMPVASRRRRRRRWRWRVEGDWIRGRKKMAPIWCYWANYPFWEAWSKPSLATRLKAGYTGLPNISRTFFIRQARKFQKWGKKSASTSRRVSLARVCWNHSRLWPKYLGASSSPWDDRPG